jgi:hypothetical protein
VRKSHGISIILGSIKKGEVSCFFDPVLSWERDPACNSVPRLGKLLGLLDCQLLKHSETVHVQEKVNLWQPAVVSRGTLNSQQTFTPMTHARVRAFQSHFLKLSVPSYLNTTPQAIERRLICPLNSTHRPKREREAQQ